MYVFVTYAHTGMRGVLARGLKVAGEFKKEDVFFLHSGDDDWLKKSGYTYESVDFDVFCPPEDVKLPNGTKCVIFCDIPTNHPYQTSILMAARKRNIATVVLENIYKKGQTKEIVYRNMAKTCDALILTGIDLFKSEVRGNVHVVPPPIKRVEESATKEAALRKKYAIPEGKKILFMSGYSDTTAMLSKMSSIMEKEAHDTVIIVSTTEQTKNKKNIIFVPYLNPDEYALLISISEVMICKKGYLQVLEAIAMEKPFVVTGKVQGFFDDWIDSELTSIISYYPHFGDDLFDRVLSLLKDNNERERFKKRLRKLHGGSLDGGLKTAEIIKKTKFSKRTPKKILLVSTATEAKLSSVKKLLKEGDFVLPFIISLPFKLRGDERSDVVMGLDYNTLADNKDILKPGFNINYHISYNSLHGLAGVFPWYGDILRALIRFADESDEIIVVGEATKKLFEPILRENRKKVKLVRV